MQLQDIIEKAKAESRSALTEAESKTILASYGIPVVKEATAESAPEAAAVAERFGFPVVLKGLGRNSCIKPNMSSSVESSEHG